MKSIFDKISEESTQSITKNYSTSFNIAVTLLAPSIRQDIYNIYGFVRVADEIVDSFEGFPQDDLLNKFEEDYYEAQVIGISTNPVINGINPINAIRLGLQELMGWHNYYTTFNRCMFQTAGENHYYREANDGC